MGNGGAVWVEVTPAEHIVTYAHSLVGIREIPDGSNDGPGVRRLQESTGAFRAPWCVSTVQKICLIVRGHTIADKTANAYYLADYATRHGWVIPHPVPGAFVVYHIGSGHAGTVVAVHRNGNFEAVEGNEGNAVRLMYRDPRLIRCTFILLPELRPHVTPARRPLDWRTVLSRVRGRL